MQSSKFLFLRLTVTCVALAMTTVPLLNTARLMEAIIIPADFAPDKKVELYTGDHVHKDGAVLVTFTSNQPIGIIRAFFPYGEDIIPLVPQSFVDEWTDNVRKMAKSLGI